MKGIFNTTHQKITISRAEIVPQFLPTYDWKGRERIAVRPDGIWVMTYQEATEHSSATPDSHTNIVFSNDQGTTWTAPNTDLNGNNVPFFPYFGDTGTDVSQNSFIIQVGVKLIFIAENRTTSNVNIGHYRYESTDGGLTWSTGTFISSYFEGTVANQNGIYCAEVIGIDIYLPVVLRNTSSFVTSSKCMMYKSTDYGISWTKISDVSAFSDITNEGSFCYLGGTSILFISRTDDVNYRYSGCKRNFSTDMGVTWQGISAITINGTGGVTCAINQPKPMKVGSRIYYFGRARRPAEQATSTNGIFWTDDNGLTINEMDLATSKGGDTGYGDGVFLSLNKFYCTGMEGIASGLTDAKAYRYLFTRNY